MHSVGITIQDTVSPPLPLTPSSYVHSPLILFSDQPICYTYRLFFHVRGRGTKKSLPEKCQCWHVSLVAQRQSAGCVCVCFVPDCVKSFEMCVLMCFTHTLPLSFSHSLSLNIQVCANWKCQHIMCQLHLLVKTTTEGTKKEQWAAKCNVKFRKVSGELDALMGFCDDLIDTIHMTQLWKKMQRLT